MTVTIYRRDGSVLFTSATATTTAEAVNEVIADARKHLSRANLSRADLSWANLSGADLSGADLSGANLSWANLSGADLSLANLSWANLSRANLSRADLSGANLSGANLSGANLSRADLSGADLSWANLSGANLSGADLSRADLSRADLSGANLSGANLSGAVNAPQLLQLGPVDNWLITLINTPTGWRVVAGCRDFTVDEARAHWKAKSHVDWGGYTEGHGNRMLAAVDALLKLAKAYGWPEQASVQTAEPAK